MLDIDKISKQFDEIRSSISRDELRAFLFRKDREEKQRFIEKLTNGELTFLETTSKGVENMELHSPEYEACKNESSDSSLAIAA